VIRRVRAVARVECLRHLTTPTLYVVWFFLALIGGFFLLRLIDNFQQLLIRFGADPEGAGLHFHQRIVVPLVFNMQLVLLLLIPLLTMRSLAVEQEEGSFELLAASVLRPTELVLGKFLALALVVSSLIAVIAVQPLTLAWFAEPGSAFDWSALGSALGGLWLLGLSFAAVGLCASSMTRHSVLAGGGAFMVLLLSWVLRSSGGGDGFWAEFLPGLSPLTRLESFAVGRLVLADLLYFFSVIATALLLAVRAVEGRRW
jgi:ABC-2 type transport system permease protein